jgi:hypothetical protein
MIPAEPTPDIARPRIRASDILAVPETREPISKMATEARNMVLTEKTLYSFPNMNWNEHPVKRLRRRVS